VATFDHYFTVRLANLGRGYADREILVNAADRAMWSEAVDVLRFRRYRTKSGSITIEFDWSPVATEVIRVTQLTTAEWLQLSERRARGGVHRPVVVKVHTVEKSRRRYENDHRLYLELALYDIFLDTNVAVPGSFTARTSIRHGNQRNSDEISFDGLIFEEAWITGRVTVGPKSNRCLWLMCLHGAMHWISERSRLPSCRR